MKSMVKVLSITAVLGWFVASVPLASAEVLKVDKGVPHYKKVAGISGNLNAVGSDTMINLMTLWAEGFKKVYSGVTVQVEGKGSATAPPALTEGSSQLGPMSREMKPKETDDFEAKHGFKPTRFKVAVDGLGVYVNKDNPIKSLSIVQLDAIFGKQRKRGAVSNITTWDQAGATGDFAGKPITMFGRNAASGTYGYFKEHALDKGDYKDEVKEQPGSAAVVQGVTEDKYAIGYSGMGYLTSGVRMISLSSKDGEPAYSAEDPANVYSGKYPLSRYLNLYVSKDPKKGLEPLVKEFLKFVFSQEGQEITIKDGFMPMLSNAVKAELEKLK
ncbi:MAG: phosphate ABC transporter substrate-binding protein [Nitrospinae bacterium]|nr:phosphate ABC transporter substrate-binding protein [Nitrospinota bacterium]